VTFAAASSRPRVSVTRHPVPGGPVRPDRPLAGRRAPDPGPRPRGRNGVYVPRITCGPPEGSVRQKTAAATGWGSSSSRPRRHGRELLSGAHTDDPNGSFTPVRATPVQRTRARPEKATRPGGPGACPRRRCGGSAPQDTTKRAPLALSASRALPRTRGRYWDRTSDLFGVNEALSR
jgi:hypothetical protein